MSETWLADLQLLRNFFLHGPLHYFYYIHKKLFEQTFILFETSLVLKNDKCWKYSGVKVWQSHLKKNNRIDNIDIIINVINSIISLKWL